MDKEEILNRWRGNFNHTEYVMFKNDIDSLLSSSNKSMELPSDEEISEQAPSFFKEQRTPWINGAKWIRDKINSESTGNEKFKVHKCKIGCLDLQNSGLCSYCGFQI